MVKSSSMVASIVGSSDCLDCLGQPPPRFGLPPPPRPPYLHDLADCSQAQFIDMKSCNAVPVIDAEYHSSPALPSLGLIVFCSVLLLIFILTLVTLLWKHKKKLQNFSPCKSSPQNRCDASHGNSVIYEDLTNMCPRQLPQQTVQMVDMKNPSVDIPFHLSLFACTPRPSNGYISQDPYNPIYEELSYGPRDKDCTRSGIRTSVSDEDFAEDELSISEKDRCSSRSIPGSLRSSGKTESPRILDSKDATNRMRYVVHSGEESVTPNEYTKKSCKKKDFRNVNMERPSHRYSNKRKIAENILLDAFFNCHTDGMPSPYTLPVSTGQCDPSSRSDRQFTTFRPNHHSDSAYSHNTFSGRSSSRVRSEYHLPYSLDFILS